MLLPTARNNPLVAVTMHVSRRSITLLHKVFSQLWRADGCGLKVDTDKVGYPGLNRWLHRSADRCNVS